MLGFTALSNHVTEENINTMNDHFLFSVICSCDPRSFLSTSLAENYNMGWQVLPALRIHKLKKERICTGEYTMWRGATEDCQTKEHTA